MATRLFLFSKVFFFLPISGLDTLAKASGLGESFLGERTERGSFVLLIIPHMLP